MWRRLVQLFLSALLLLAPACGGAERETSQPRSAQPVGAEPARTEPAVFVEAPPDPVRAKSEASEPQQAQSPEQREQAKLAFQDGVLLFEAGNFAAAVEKFREAYLLAPLPALLFNIARGQEQLGDLVGACESYRKIRADPLADAAMHEAAAQQLAQLNCP
jgi:tetratricopeptide (TPR) repeat protein